MDRFLIYLNVMNERHIYRLFILTVCSNEARNSEIALLNACVPSCLSSLGTFIFYRDFPKLNPCSMNFESKGILSHSKWEV